MEGLSGVAACIVLEYLPGTVISLLKFVDPLVHLGGWILLQSRVVCPIAATSLQRRYFGSSVDNFYPTSAAAATFIAAYPSNSLVSASMFLCITIFSVIIVFDIT